MWNEGIEMAQTAYALDEALRRGDTARVNGLAELLSRQVRDEVSSQAEQGGWYEEYDRATNLDERVYVAQGNARRLGASGLAAPDSRDYQAKETFCSIRWMRDDIVTAIKRACDVELDRNGTEADEVESIIDRVIDEVSRGLQEQSTVEGWDIIDALMPDDAIVRAKAVAKLAARRAETRAHNALVTLDDRQAEPLVNDGSKGREIWRAGDGIDDFERIAFLTDEWLLPSESLIAKLTYGGAAAPSYHMYESLDDLLHPDADDPLRGGSIAALRLSGGDLAIDFRGRGIAAAGDSVIKVRAAGENAVTLFNAGARWEGAGAPRVSRPHFEGAWGFAEQLDVDDILDAGNPSLADLERDCIESAGYTEDRGAVVLESREDDGR